MAMAQAASGKRRSFYADLDHLRSHFDSLDQDRTGYIGYNELTQLVEKMSDIEDAVLPELMKKLDRDKDGKVSFDDFQALFEVEREAIKKKIKIAPSESSELKSKPKSPTRGGAGRRLPELPTEPSTVVLRKNPGRRHLGSEDFGSLSPIRSGTAGSHPPSSDFPEKGPGQMQYLMIGMDTTDPASPQLKRNSKVLSIFNDSEDLQILEAIGDGSLLDNTNNILSPPLSPKNNEEASHVVGVLESVIEGRLVDKEAISKLCTHLEADQHEEKELVGLLGFLDKEGTGSVPVEEFVRGLQACRNAAEVASTPFRSPDPEPLPLSRRHTIATESLPKLSESFSTPVHAGVRGNSTPLASTPLHQPVYSKLVLSVLDPDKSGYVKMDSLVEQIQQMGVEADHNSSVEEALAEAVTVNPGGRVNVSELTTSLEGAMLTDGKTNNFLRQIALRTFHSEIDSLRSQVHQVSMERDTLQSNLNKTLEENRKLVETGEEQVDFVTKESEQKLKTQENVLTQQLREKDKSRREEQFQIEDRYSDIIQNLQEKLDKVKSEEQRLRDDLKLTQDEVTLTVKQLSAAHVELDNKERTIAILQRDLESRSGSELIGDDQQSHVEKLERDLEDKGTTIKELQERLRETQDRYDLVYADNEKLKQKYLTAKRDLQRRRNRKTSSDKPASGYGRSQRPKRPLSGSHFGRSSPIKPPIFRSPLDLAITAEEKHPVLYEDMDDSFPSDHSDHEFAPVFSPTKEEMVETEILPEEMPVEVAAVTEVAEVVAGSSSTSSTERDSPEDEDIYSRSTASLMEEIHVQEQKSLLDIKLKQLEEEHYQLQTQYQQLEQQLREARELDSMRIKLSNKIESHEQAIATLKQQLSAAEKNNDIYLDQSLKLEEEKAQVEETLASLRNALQSEKSGHEAEVNILMQKLENAEQMIARLEQKEQQNVMQLREELEHSRDEIQRYKKQTEDLSLQLAGAQEKLRSIAEDTQTLKKEGELQAMPPVEPSLMREEIESLQRRLTESQTELEQLRASNREHLLHAQKLQATMDEHTRQTEGEMTIQLDQFRREKEALQAECEEQLGEIRKELEAARSREVKLTTELSRVQAECEEQLGETRKELEAARSREVKLTTELSRVQAACEEQLGETRKELEAARSREVKLTTELSRVQAACEEQLGETRKELEAARSREVKLTTELSRVQAACEEQLGETRKELEAARSREVKLTTELSRVQAACEEQLGETRKELEAARSREVKLTTELSRVQAACEEQLGETRKELEAARSREVKLTTELSRVQAACEEQLGETRKELEAARSREVKLTTELSRVQAACEEQLGETRKELEAARSREVKLTTELSRVQAACEEQLGETRKELEAARSREVKLTTELSRVQAACEEQLGETRKELEAARSREVKLTTELSRVQTECEGALSKVREFSEREANHLRRIEVLEMSEVSHKQEITQLHANIEKYQGELVQVQEKKNVTSVSAQPPPEKLSRDGEDEPDFVPAPVYVPRKPSYNSTQDPQERIINQMKGQLEDLQRILQTKSGKREGAPESTLVQSLLATNTALEKEMQQRRQAFDKEQQRLCGMLSDKDKSLAELQLKALEQKAALRSSVLVITQEVIELIGNLKGASDESLSDCQARVEEAAGKLAYVRQLLVERDGKHASSVDKMLSNLKHSQEESDGYKLEIERLTQALNTSQREESTSRQPQAGADQRVDAESGQIFHSHVELEISDSKESSLLAKQEEEIHHLKEELEKMRRLEEEARSKSESQLTDRDKEIAERDKEIAERDEEIAERDKEIAERDKELNVRAKRIQELEVQLREPVNEHVESVVQYVEVQPLEGVNEALLLNMNQDSRERLVIKSQIPVEETSPMVSAEPDDRDQLAANLEAAKQRLEAFEQIQRTLEIQHQQAIQEIVTKHEAELSVTNEVIEEHTANLRDLYLSVVGGDKKEAGRLSHSQLVGEIKEEFDRLKSELASEQMLVNEMEETMTRRIAEHDQMETQIHTEHEEEVKALHQQKQQLARQLEDAKMRYYQLTKEQDQQSNTQIQELLGSKSELERQLRQKTEESLLVYQQVAELQEEKTVLMDIIEHLCVEAGKLIDVV